MADVDWPVLTYKILWIKTGKSASVIVNDTIPGGVVAAMAVKWHGRKNLFLALL